MKRFLIALAGLALLAGPAVAGDTYVKGYTKKDGTYVQGHYRSKPNSTANDNYSTKGNINPYTGKPGTKPRESDSYGGFGSSYTSPYSGSTQKKSDPYSWGSGYDTEE